MKEVYDFIKKCGTYYLATVDADGQPRNRPFGTINIFEDKLYIYPYISFLYVFSVKFHPFVKRNGITVFHNLPVTSKSRSYKQTEFIAWSVLFDFSGECGAWTYK